MDMCIYNILMDFFRQLWSEALFYGILLLFLSIINYCPPYRFRTDTAAHEIELLFLVINDGDLVQRKWEDGRIFLPSHLFYLQLQFFSPALKTEDIQLLIQIWRPWKISSATISQSIPKKYRLLVYTYKLRFTNNHL